MHFIHVSGSVLIPLFRSKAFYGLFVLNSTTPLSHAIRLHILEAKITVVLIRVDQYGTYLNRRSTYEED